MSNMQSVFRRKRTRNFTVLGNETLEDGRLTFEARGLLCFLLAKPADWTVVMSHLINSSPAGKHKIRRMVDELLTHGYLVRSTTRDDDGRFNCTLYEVYDEPQSDYRKVDNREAENPQADKQPLQKKQITKNTSNKETPTTKEDRIDLVWPALITKSLRSSFLKSAQNNSTEQIQKAVDEIAGRIDSNEQIKNPVGYFRSLLKRIDEDNFVSAYAIQTEEKRNKLIRGEKNIRKIHELSEKARLKMIEEHTKSQ